MLVCMDDDLNLTLAELFEGTPEIRDAWGTIRKEMPEHSDKYLLTLAIHNYAKLLALSEKGDLAEYVSQVATGRAGL